MSVIGKQRGARIQGFFAISILDRPPVADVEFSLGAGEDRAAAVDEISRRRAVDPAEVVPRGRPPAGREGEAVLQDVVARHRGIVIETQGDDPESLCRVLAIELFELRQFPAAYGTPGRPEHDENDPAALLGEREFRAVEKWRIEGRRAAGLSESFAQRQKQCRRQLTPASCACRSA
jgi:hypothetical protein